MEIHGLGQCNLKNSALVKLERCIFGNSRWL